MEEYNILKSNLVIKHMLIDGYRGIGTKDYLIKLIELAASLGKVDILIFIKIFTNDYYIDRKLQDLIFANLGNFNLNIQKLIQDECLKSNQKSNFENLVIREMCSNLGIPIPSKDKLLEIFMRICYVFLEGDDIGFRHFRPAYFYLFILILMRYNPNFWDIVREVFLNERKYSFMISPDQSKLDSIINMMVISFDGKFCTYYFLNVEGYILREYKDRHQQTKSFLESSIKDVYPNN